MQPNQPSGGPAPPTPEAMAPRMGGGGTVPAAAFAAGGGLSRILSVVAVVLAAAALGVAFAVPGPTGPAGSQGPAGSNGTNGAQGPPGPPGAGTLMSSTSAILNSEMFTGCLGIASGQVTMNVPGPGTIWVQASVTASGFHYSGSGSGDGIFLYLSTVASECTADAWTSTMLILDNYAPSQSFWPTGHVQEPFAVSGAGSFTVYVSASLYISSSGSQDYWRSVGLVAVFYPS